MSSQFIEAVGWIIFLLGFMPTVEGASRLREGGGRVGLNHLVLGITVQVFGALMLSQKILCGH